MDKLASFLSYKIGNELFACSVNNIQSIIEYTEPTKIPGTDKSMVGILNTRGQVLPIMDMRILFDINSLNITNNTSILVLETEINQSPVLIGAIVDAVSEVFEISDKEIIPPPKIGISTKSEFVKGIYHNAKQTIMLLACDKLFTNHHSEIEQLDMADT